MTTAAGNGDSLGTGTEEIGREERRGGVGGAGIAVRDGKMAGKGWGRTETGRMGGR